MLNLFAATGGGAGAVDRNSFAETSNGGLLLGSFTKAPSGNSNWNIKKELEDEFFFGNAMQEQPTEQKGRRSLSN